MKGITLLSLITTALAAPGARPLPPLITIADLNVTSETDNPSALSANTDPNFCHYDIWEYSTWDCTGDIYSGPYNKQSTECYSSFYATSFGPNHCLWIRPLGDDRCFHDNTAWFYKSPQVGSCGQHHKFEGHFDGEVRMNLHHPWDSMILNK